MENLEELPESFKQAFFILRCRKLMPAYRIAKELNIKRERANAILKTKWFREREADYVKRLRKETYASALKIEKYRSSGIENLRDASDKLNRKVAALAELCPKDDFVFLKEVALILDKATQLTFKLGFLDQEHKLQTAAAGATKVGVQVAQVGGDPTKAKNSLLEAGMDLNSIFLESPSSLPGETAPVTLDVNLLEE